MNRLSRFAAVGLIALMVGAQAADTPPEPPMHGKHPHRADGALGHGPLQMLNRHKVELKLSAAQEKQWQAAEAASQAASQARRDAHAKLRESLAAEREKEVLDLAKIDELIEQQREQAQAQQRAVHEQWLAVYASLSQEQKRMASQHIKQGMARMDKRMARKHRHHDGPPPGAPMH